MAVQLSARQLAYIRKKTKVHEPDPSEVMGELNIVPFLDIVVNIIMFLLAVTAYIVLTGELDARLPTMSRGGRGGNLRMQPALNLTVTVGESGIIVAGAGGKLAPGCERLESGRVITVPNLPNPNVDLDGDKLPDIYDWRGLRRCLVTVKRAYPDETQVILTADPQVEYRHLIRAMDVVRADGENSLFPDILLSAGVR
ncbi:MAG: biopolymer transporter ExbD [Sandaracinaceae bacterium]|nr:biopolymer transporter ExbD [Sandaracinaceae bacterium]MDW8246388.1 biopolymer transporter ExbD [Sandaracinaceae bacterium]